MSKMIALVAIAGAASIAGAQGMTIFWDENVDGDLSNDPLNASIGGQLSVGMNIVRGATGPGSGFPGDEGFDSLQFSVGAGQTVTDMVLNAYNPLTGGSSGFVLFDGPQGTGSASPFIGGSTGDGIAIGTDLFDQIGITSLGEGTYVFEVREFGGPRSTWEVSFNVVPTPGAAAVLGLGGLAAMRRRR